MARFDHLLPQSFPFGPKAPRAFLTTTTSRLVRIGTSVLQHAGTQSKNLAPLFRKLRHTCIVQNRLQMPLPIPHLSLWISIAAIVVHFAPLLAVRALRQLIVDNTQPA